MENNPYNPIMDKEREALEKDGRENFVGGYVDMHLFAGLDPSQTGIVRKIAELQMSAFTTLFQSFKLRKYGK